jgi:CRISPR system Cascade subunit CasC
VKFLNIHIIQSLPYSNLNRDDSGSPKSLMYGGSMRARLSSQALKRAARTSFEADSRADATERSKYTPERVLELAVDMLVSQGVEITDETREKLRAASKTELGRLVSKEAKDKKPKKGAESEFGKTETLTWLAEKEILAAAAKVAASVTGEKLDEYISSATDSLTIAGFGRMFAVRSDLQTDAAVQVAHAFTTHEAAIEVDYFTAVDDLRASFEGDEGSGHLDLAEFTSGVFYRYLNVDREQLLANWSASSAADAEERLHEWFLSLIMSLPSGKSNATAPYTIPSLVIVEESRQPLSFAPAFEAPVQASDRGFGQPSVETLLEFANRARATAGPLFGTRRLLCTSSDMEAATLQELLEFCTNWTLGLGQ